MRTTPAAGLTRRTPDESVIAVASPRSGVAGARALSLLADRLSAAGVLHDLDGARGSLVRDALRQLVARTRNASLIIRVVDGAIAVEGAEITRRQASDDPLLSSLRQRLLRHDVGALSVRDGAAPGELLTLGRLLAGSVARSGDSAREVGVSTPSEANAIGDSGQAPTSRELLRTWSVLVLRAHDAEEESESAASESQAANPFSRLASARTDEAAMHAVASLADDVDEIVRRGDAARLDEVARAFANSIEAIGTGAGRIALEGGLRRLLRSDAIALLATQVAVTPDRNALLAVFARTGEVGVRALADGLMNASSANARRAYFDAIVAMDVGGSILRESLHDDRWFVVRNTAALLGEMGVAEADIALIDLLRNPDERLRIAAARALIRLRTPRSLAALHGAVDDSNPEVRRIAATSYNVAVSTAGMPRPTAGRLAASLEREEDEDVALEMLAAMGRLGSADAVQRLLRIAQSPTVDSPASAGADERGYVPRPTWIRIAALEALVEARGDAVASTVEALVSDADPLVADAAFRLRVI